MACKLREYQLWLFLSVVACSGVLKQSTVQFEPPLPQWKTAAIEAISCGHCHKLVLAFDQCFWDEAMCSLTVTTEVFGEFWAFNSLKPLGVDAMTVEITGPYVLAMEAHSDAQVVERAMELLGQAIPSAPDAPASHSRVSRWASDPLAGGAYSHLSISSNPTHPAALAQPVGKSLFFAGEASCHEFIGTVHGAMISGQRSAWQTARSKNQSLNHQNTDNWLERASQEIFANFSDSFWQSTEGCFAGDCTQVGFVNYSENSLHSLVNLGCYTGLRFLDLSENELGSLEGVEQVPWLTHLNCASNELKTLKGIEACTELVWLSVADNNLRNVNELAGLRALEQLNVSSNSLKNIQPLSGCVELVVLDVQDNDLKDDNVLANVANSCLHLSCVRVWNNDYNKAGLKRAKDDVRNECKIVATKCAKFTLRNPHHKVTNSQNDLQSTHVSIANVVNQLKC